MGLFERWLTLWVALSILAGLVLGGLMPGVFGVLAGLEYASVNLVVAILIWAMVYPLVRPMTVAVPDRLFVRAKAPDRRSPSSGSDTWPACQGN
jgi:ACR3 family arsenite efflux pump ArsB